MLPRPVLTKSKLLPKAGRPASSAEAAGSNQGARVRDKWIALRCDTHTDKDTRTTLTGLYPFSPEPAVERKCWLSGHSSNEGNTGAAEPSATNPERKSHWASG